MRAGEHDRVDVFPGPRREDRRKGFCKPVRVMWLTCRDRFGKPDKVDAAMKDNSDLARKVLNQLCRISPPDGARRCQEANHPRFGKRCGRFDRRNGPHDRNVEPSANVFEGERACRIAGNDEDVWLCHPDQRFGEHWQPAAQRLIALVAIREKPGVGRVIDFQRRRYLLDLAGHRQSAHTGVEHKHPSGRYALACRARSLSVGHLISTSARIWQFETGVKTAVEIRQI